MGAPRPTPAEPLSKPPDGRVCHSVDKLGAEPTEPPITHRRRALLERSWAARGRYQDPSAQVRGRAALDQHIAEFLKNNPGARIEPTSAVDLHHGMVRFTWRMVGPNGATVMEGMDFGEFGADGRLVRIVGFFGPPRQKG